MTNKTIYFKIGISEYNLETSTTCKFEVLYKYIEGRFGRKDFIILGDYDFVDKSKKISDYNFSGFIVAYDMNYDEIIKKCKK